MNQSLDEWEREYERLQNALALYWIPADAEMSEPERIFSDLCYYWSAALCNNGDVFGYVPYIVEHEADLVTIGAAGTLEALAELMPYYLKQEKLGSQDEMGEYWWRTREERKPVEAIAEGVNEFGRLLLAYAQRNLSTRR